MTVIAWDGKTLAADKRATKWGLVYTVTKIFRVSGPNGYGYQLVGVSGDATRGAELIAWLESGGDPARYPPLLDKENKAVLMCIGSDRRIRLYENTAFPYVVEDAMWAEGQGRDFALSAMHSGRTATEAVEWASRFLDGCGNGIDTLTLEA